MIQWIALALAVDAENKAGEAREKAEEANHNSRSSSVFVIVRPVNFIHVPTGEPKIKFLGIFPYTPTKKVLDKKPLGTFSIKRSDIENIEEGQDADGTKYCRLAISEYAKLEDDEENTIIGLYVPGSIEEVTRILEGR